MATSPPEHKDVEQTQSGDEESDMNRIGDDAQGGLGDFEVKEQDRWLPIANGEFLLCLLSASTRVTISDLSA